jgi:hypothetical protein
VTTVQPVQPAQPPHPAPERGTWRPNETLAQWCCIALVVMAALGVGEVIAHANRIRVAGDYNAGNVTRGALHNADAFVSTMAVLWTLGVLATAALFITWQWRSAKNAELSTGPLRWSPGWSIGGWFIPFANWVIPYLCIQEISQSTTRHADGLPSDERSLVPWWWAAFVGATLLRLIGNGMAGGDLTYSQLRNRDAVWCVASLLGVAAAVLGILVVRRLTEAQQAVRGTAPAMSARSAVPAARVEPDPVATPQPQPQALPAGGWYPDPLRRAELRYWDGATWTPHVSNAGVVGYDSPGG